MAFTIQKFALVRPYLYHLTSRRNLKRLRQTRVIFSTAELFAASQNEAWLDQKRRDMLTITIDGAQIDIRDQKPLYSGKTRLEGGWTFSDLIRQLNSRIFFWPGWKGKPISYGVRHFERYKNDEPAIIRVNTAKLFDANKNSAPQFCKFNSGSPRTSQGIGSPRGPDTFVECSVASFLPSNVVEVTFVNAVTLPSFESATTPLGPWKTHA